MIIASSPRKRETRAQTTKQESGEDATATVDAVPETHKFEEEVSAPQKWGTRQLALKKQKTTGKESVKEEVPSKSMDAEAEEVPAQTKGKQTRKIANKVDEKCLEEEEHQGNEDDDIKKETEEAVTGGKGIRKKSRKPAAAKDAGTAEEMVSGRKAIKREAAKTKKEAMPDPKQADASEPESKLPKKTMKETAIKKSPAKRGKKGDREQSSDSSGPSGDKAEGDGQRGGPAQKRQKKQDSKEADETVAEATGAEMRKGDNSSKPWNLKICSWNINGIRAWMGKDGLAYVKSENPDIMTIQETKCADSKLPKEVKELEGYHTYFLSGDQEGYSGIGLLSKVEPIKVTYGIGMEEHDKEGRVITAEYEKFFLVAAYVPNAGKKLVRLNYRMDWDKNFASYLDERQKNKPVILCGDLNVAHQPIDLENPKTNKRNAGFTDEEREGFSALLSMGFLDSFRHLYPEARKAYTFWTYMMNARAKDVGWRLDYFVLSKSLEANLVDSLIRKHIMGSDHCPIVLLLNI